MPCVRRSTATRGEVGESALLYHPPVVQQRFERETSVNGAPLGVLQGGNGFPQRRVAEDVLVNPEVLYGRCVDHEVFDAVQPRTVQQRAG